MITLDGSEGHGGGSVLRIASGLAALTRTPIKVENIRISRPNPGMQAQHLSGLRGVADFCKGKLLGDELGSTEMDFYPGTETRDCLSISIQTAGSVSLALQPILIASALSRKRIRVSMNGGGTMVKWAPPTDFLENITFRLLEKMGFKIRLFITRHGFYPAGGARLEADISVPHEIMPLYIPERGKIFFCKGISRAAYGMESFDAAENMSISCSEAMEKYFSSRNIKIKPEIKSSYEKTDSQGYCLTSWAESENTIIGASEMGDKKDLPEEIGKNVAQNLEKFLDSGATLDSNSADQVLPFMALAKGSEIKIAEMTGHIETSIALTEKFLKMKFKIEKENDGIRISC